MLRLLCAAALLLLAPELPAQSLLFSTFGPGDSFSTNPGLTIGFGRVWNLTGNNGAQLAFSFTPSHTDQVTRIDLVIDNHPVQGSTSTPILKIALCSDDGGVPGDPVETIQAVNPFNGILGSAILSVRSRLRPAIHSGTKYWVLLSAEDQLNTAFEWFFAPQGTPSTGFPGDFIGRLTGGSDTNWELITDSNGIHPVVALFGADVPDAPVPVIAPAGIVNAASFSTGPYLAPGSWVSIFGSNFSSSARSWTAADFAADGTLPTLLDGVSVIVGAELGAVSYISPGQVNVQIPDFGDPFRSVPIQIVSPNGVSDPVSITLNPSAAGLFSFFVSGTPYAAATFADGTLMTPAHPAHPGDAVSLYGTGFGPTDPPTPSGRIVSTPAPFSIPRGSIVLGGLAPALTYAGEIEAGLDQINIIVPELLPGVYPLSLDYAPQNTPISLMFPIAAR